MHDSHHYLNSYPNHFPHSMSTQRILPPKGCYQLLRTFSGSREVARIPLNRSMEWTGNLQYFKAVAVWRCLVDTSDGAARRAPLMSPSALAQVAPNFRL